MAELKLLICQEHHRAELQRLRLGMEGCGCAECQAYYETLDLSKFGERMKQYGGVINIQGGMTGADLVDAKQPQDCRARDGTVFIHYGKGYIVTLDGESLCFGPVDGVGKPLTEELPQHTPKNASVSQQAVAKIPTKGIIPPVDTQKLKKAGIMQHRGRPRKKGEVHRITAWRRRKQKETQGALL